MPTLETATYWLKHWLYDWGGANIKFFVVIQRTWPDGFIWLPELLSVIGSYWVGLVVVPLLLCWIWGRAGKWQIVHAVALCRFLLGLALAMTAAALAKAMFALPRPFELLGDAVYRAASIPDSQYTFPSGHAAYIAVMTAALWPLLDRYVRFGLLFFGMAVGWSRIVLGAHFPVDVIAGFALGWLCVACTGAWAQRLALRLPLAEAMP